MTFTEILEVFTVLSPVLLISGLIIGFSKYSTLDPVHRLLVIYFAICLGIDISSRISGYYFKNNLIFIPLMSLLELAVFARMYFRYLFEEKYVLLRVITAIAAAYMGAEIVRLLATGASQFQSYARPAGTFAIVLMSITYFFDKIEREEFLPANRFSINTAFFIYFSLSFVLFLPLNFLVNGPTGLIYFFWLGTLFVTIVFYAFLIRSIWKNGKTRERLRYGS